jgi:hypothetical protein
MSAILDIWRNLKLCKSNIFLNEGLSNIEIKKNQEFINKYIPEELLEILKNSNGQIANSESLFSEFKNNILGITFSHYNFLSLDEIIETYEELRPFFKKKDEDAS